jgi:hypothetical protein
MKRVTILRQRGRGRSAAQRAGLTCRRGVKMKRAHTRRADGLDLGGTDWMQFYASVEQDTNANDVSLCESR